MSEAVRLSEDLITNTRLHAVISQKASVFMLTAVITQTSYGLLFLVTQLSQAPTKSIPLFYTTTIFDENYKQRGPSIRLQIFKINQALLLP